MPPSPFSRELAILRTEEEPSLPTKKRKEIFYDGFYYDVTDWIDRHPGGKIIEFYTESGEDATCAIQQFHNRAARVMGMMKAFKRRPARDHEIGLKPATLERHRALSADFTQLHLELEKEGLFEPSLAYVAIRVLELIFFLTAGLYLMHAYDSWVLYALGIFSLGLFMGRSGVLVHDCGHISLAGRPKLDRFLAIVAFGLGDGLSASWYMEHHNQHHAMPQRLERDVNLDTLPLVTFSSRCVKDPKTARSFFIRHQAALFFAIDTFIIIIYWKFYHAIYALQRKYWAELSLMIIHFALAIYFVGFLPYAVAGWFGSVYMIGNISLSHTHLPVTDEPLHWVEYGLVHTMDIHGSWLCDWWMGHLNYQIEHHLFPTLPPFRLPLVAARVKGLAEKHNIPYICTSYTEAIRLTLDNLAHVSKELAQM